MIGLDTDILVRYLTQDDPVQSAKATDILERRLTPKNPGFVSVVVVVETVWVLDRAYGLTAREIAAAVERLLQVEVLMIEDERGGFHCHGRAETRTCVICGRADRRAWSAGRVYAHFDVRPKGRAASNLRACVIAHDPPSDASSSGCHHVE